MIQKRSIAFVVFVCFFLTQNLISAQTSVADSINSRLENLVKTSNSYQNYKVIKTGRIHSLRQEITSEVSSLEGEIEELKNKIEDKDTHISKIQTNLTKSNTDLKTAIDQKDKLSILGIGTNKSTYNIVVTLIILFLLLGLITFLYKFKKSNQVTVTARQRLKENQEEFDLFRKQALETQQKLGRQIVNERNKSKQ